jgi:hypothetical protein
MQIKAGSEKDSDQCRAIIHEYYKCRDAFEQFRVIAEQLILGGQNREISYRAYNSYSYFILHLYEFLMACHAREFHNTRITNKKGSDRTEYLDALIMSDTKRVLNLTIDQIREGLAPSWENDISHYENLLPIPPEFPSEFRVYRNKIAGHASFERIASLNLTEFYEKYHFYLHLLYRVEGNYWGRKYKEFPCLKDVTNFFKVIANET